MASPVAGPPVRQSRHRYELGRRLQQTGQDRRIKYSRGSLYAVFEQLCKAGLVEARGTDRAGQLPERTTYAITPTGREEFYNWLRTLVVHPHEEYPHFIIALSFISLLHPNEAVTLLRERIAALTATAVATQNALQSAAADGHLWVFLIEKELVLDLLDTEIRFIHGLIERLSNRNTSEAGNTKSGARHDRRRQRWSWRGITGSSRSPRGHDGRPQAR